MADKFKTVTIRLTEDEHRELKILAAKKGLTIKSILMAGIETLRKEKE